MCTYFHQWSSIALWKGYKYMLSECTMISNSCMCACFTIISLSNRACLHACAHYAWGEGGHGTTCGNGDVQCPIRRAFHSNCANQWWHSCRWADEWAESRLVYICLLVCECMNYNIFVHIYACIYHQLLYFSTVQRKVLSLPISTACIWKNL